MFSVITVSDSCYAGSAKDSSGPHLVGLIKQSLEPVSVNYLLIPDEQETIEKSLSYACDILKARAVFTTGGTGFGPRDVTPEATRAVIAKEAPQLAMAMMLHSMQKTKFAALSRAVCGVRGRTLIVNLPGSKKAVQECFESVLDVLPHVLNLLCDAEIGRVRQTHGMEQGARKAAVAKHICPHATGKGSDDDRNSPYPMVSADEALKLILSTLDTVEGAKCQLSRVNIPPFRASIKDGYALKSIGGKGMKKVIGYVAAGDPTARNNFTIDECFKINTGAPVPEYADAVIQIEDTKLVSRENDYEKIVEILTNPTPDLDVRAVGSDLRMSEEVFRYRFPLDASQRALLAAIGEKASIVKLKVAVLSTGDELLHPYDPSALAEAASLEGKIYDSNTTMLVALMRQFGFSDDQCEIQQLIVKDDFASLRKTIEALTNQVHIIVCTGGVSMGDKDFVKPVLKTLGYELGFGRVNIKPGKPCTFASLPSTKFFGLPGNPVSAFVTFHLFVLPALRWCLGVINKSAPQAAKCCLPIIDVELLDTYELDPRPEYARASLRSRRGKLTASITGDQLSSKLKSTIEADALVELPARTDQQTTAKAGTLLKAYVIRSDFISQYD